MGQHVRIPFTDKHERHVEPMPAWGIAQDGHIFIRCKCGACMLLDIPTSHAVGPGGKVAPSMHHDAEWCGWHVFGLLEGWAEKRAEHARRLN